MAKLYSNENFPLAVVKLLRNWGHDVRTVAGAGNAGQRIPDDEVLAFACQEQRAVLTLNRRDFIRLHLMQPEHAGIIVCTRDDDIVGQAMRIHQAILGAGILDNQLLRINRPPR